jgi:hypothetical protein
MSIFSTFPPDGGGFEPAGTSAGAQPQPTKCAGKTANRDPRLEEEVHSAVQGSDERRAERSRTAFWVVIKERLF